jgi:ABC-type glycerol-3-phosphate transport system substrate-binding protein
MTNRSKRMALALAATAVLATATGCTTSQATSSGQASCTELAVWPQMVQTHGVDEAARMWAQLVTVGWTNPRSGEPTYLVQPGCADAWSA